MLAISLTANFNFNFFLLECVLLVPQFAAKQVAKIFAPKHRT